MTSCQRAKLALGAAAIIMMAMTAAPQRAAAEDQYLYVEVYGVTRAPIGWVEFCTSQPAECAATPTTPRDVVLSGRAFKDLQRVNKWVNDTIKPMTDIEHWGVIEKWSYPDDGYGD